MRNLENIKRIVVKVGTTNITYSNGKLNLDRLNKLAQVLTNLQNSGKEIILVTSGSIALGKNLLGFDLDNRNLTINEKQAASSVGQSSLMGIYSKFFNEYNQRVSQILLTKNVIENETSLTNAKNTFETLIKLSVIPIVNENDTISTDELGFSDNDTLSANVSVIANSDLLIILSDIEGLFDDDPNKNKNAKLITEVNSINENIKNLAGDSASSLGTGGMHTKILASEICLSNNIQTIIAKGEHPEIINEILEGHEVGTLFKIN